MLSLIHILYVKLNEMAVKTGFADLVDAEAFTGTDEVNTIVETAHLYGVKVIASNHDFQKTQPKEEIVSRLCFMQELSLIHILHSLVMTAH